MSIEHYIAVHNPEKHRFEAQVGEVLAVAEYRLNGKTIAFTHTEVPPAIEGCGVGATLVRAALEHAREQGYRVIPECPFVAQFIHRHAEYADLLSG